MRKTHLNLICILSIGLLARSASGQDSAEARAGVEPTADKILRQMSTYLADAKQFSFEAYDMHDQVLDTGQKIQLANTRRISVRRPDKVFAELSGDIDDERIWYDGKTVTVLDTERNVYGVMEVPDNIDAMLDYVVETLGQPVPVADILFSDPYTIVIANVRQGRYLGRHDVHGAKCHHLAFRQEVIDWQIWVEVGDMPVPRKLVITYKDYPGQPQYIAFLGEWNMSPEFPDELFSCKLPEAAKRIDLERVRKRGATDQTRVDEVKSEDEETKE